MLLLIQKSFNTPFRGFLELFVIELVSIQLAVSRELLVDFFQVGGHQFVQFLIGNFFFVYQIEIGVDQGYEFSFFSITMDSLI